MSAPQRELLRPPPVLPLRLLQLGLVAFGLGITDAEIGDEFPGIRHVENGVDAIAICPPLIVNKSHIDDLVAAITGVLNDMKPEVAKLTPA